MPKEKGTPYSFSVHFEWDRKYHDGLVNAERDGEGQKSFFFSFSHLFDREKKDVKICAHAPRLYICAVCLLLHNCY